MKESSKADTLDVFFGIDAAYADSDGIKMLVDEVKSYTNLFVIGSTGVTWNYTKLNEICQYLYDSGLYFLVYMHPTEDFSQAQWIEESKQRWLDKFLGLYAYDEPGGHQMDRDKPYMLVEEANNYTDAANKYIDKLNDILKISFTDYVQIGDLPLFASDYTLYWFDYRAGYDVLLAEFGWNYSRQLNIMLCRGAATVQNKEWGVIVTWTYNSPPYIESGEELYNDLILAYNNGAKYILVFDTNKNYTRGTLEKEHSEALKQFWQYMQDNPRKADLIDERVAYVLPTDYGYGFRGPNDKIWGLWEADAVSYEICTKLNSLMEQYGTKLDIIYDDKREPYDTSAYSKLIFWNDTINANS